jgi:hypothetical protein
MAAVSKPELSQGDTQLTAFPRKADRARPPTGTARENLQQFTALFGVSFYFK